MLFFGWVGYDQNFVKLVLIYRFKIESLFGFESFKNTRKCLDEHKMNRKRKVSIG